MIIRQEQSKQTKQGHLLCAVFNISSSVCQINNNPIYLEDINMLYT